MNHSKFIMDQMKYPAFLIIFTFLHITTVLGQHNIVDDALEVRIMIANIIEATAKKKPKIPSEIRRAITPHLPMLYHYHQQGKVLELFSHAGWEIDEQQKQLISDYTYQFLGPNHLSIVKMSSQDLEQSLLHIPDDIFFSLSYQFDLYLKDVTFKQNSALNLLTHPDHLLTFEVQKDLKEFFESLVENYFDELPVIDKKYLVAGQLRLPPNADDMTKLASFLNKSGPMAQKLFQFYGDQAQSQDLREVMGGLKSSIPPMKSSVALSRIQKAFKLPLDEVFSYLGSKAFSAATVGEVHSGTLAKDDQEVIVKVIRPIRKRALREREVFMRLAKTYSAKELVKKLGDNIMKELDLILEHQNIQKAKVYLNYGPHLDVVKVAESTLPHRNVLVMKKAQGQPLTEFKSEDELRLKLKALIDFYRIWIDEAIFKSGFFHADPHAGNLFLEEQEQSKKGYKLTLIDFGNIGQLGERERHGTLLVGVGLTFFSTHLVMQGFELFSPVSKEVKKSFHKQGNKIFHNFNLLPWQKSQHIMQLAGELKIDLPEGLILFTRGQGFLTYQIFNTIDRINQITTDKPLKQMTDLTLQDPVMKNRIGPEVKSYLNPFSGKRNRKYLTNRDIKKFIRSVAHYHLYQKKYDRYQMRKKRTTRQRQ